MSRAEDCQHFLARMPLDDHELSIDNSDWFGRQGAD
jgi:hypothetical protein